VVDRKHNLAGVAFLNIFEIFPVTLTEVTVVSLFVYLTHGDVPASSSADASVARPLALQGFPGQP